MADFLGQKCISMQFSCTFFPACPSFPTQSRLACVSSTDRNACVQPGVRGSPIRWQVLELLPLDTVLELASADPDEVDENFVVKKIEEESFGGKGQNDGAKFALQELRKFQIYQRHKDVFSNRNWTWADVMAIFEEWTLEDLDLLNGDDPIEGVKRMGPSSFSERCLKVLFIMSHKGTLRRFAKKREVEWLQCVKVRESG